MHFITALLVLSLLGGILTKANITASVIAAILLFSCLTGCLEEKAPRERLIPGANHVEGQNLTILTRVNAQYIPEGQMEIGGYNVQVIITNRGNASVAFDKITGTFESGYPDIEILKPLSGQKVLGPGENITMDYYIDVKETKSIVSASDTGRIAMRISVENEENEIYGASSLMPRLGKINALGWRELQPGDVKELKLCSNHEAILELMHKGYTDKINDSNSEGLFDLMGV